MTTVAIPELQPRSMGQILDQAIRIYRRNFGHFVGIVAIVQVPLTLLQLGLAYLMVSGVLVGLESAASSLGDLFGPTYFLGLVGSVITGLLSFVLLWSVAAGVLARTVAGLYIGEALTLGAALRQIAGHTPRLIGAILLALILMLLAGIWTMIPCVGWLTGPSFLVLCVTAIIPLIAPIIVIEKKTAVDAVLRAWHLVRRRLWWVIGFVLILYLFNLLIVVGPGAIVTIILQAGAGRALAASDYTATIVQTIVQALASLLLGLIYMPLHLTCMVSLYLDLRVRTEGLDLALQTARAQPGEMTLAQALAYAPPAKGNLITWKELGSLVLISLAPLALVGCLYAVLVALVLLVALP